MPSVVIDTHTLVWYMLGSPRLSHPARQAIATATTSGHPALVPSICVVELLYLVEKGRIPTTDWQTIDAALGANDSELRVVPLTHSVARDIARVPWSRVPDMPDRIIAATALHLGLPLVSRDRRIDLPGLQVVW